MAQKDKEEKRILKFKYGKEKIVYLFGFDDHTCNNAMKVVSKKSFYYKNEEEQKVSNYKDTFIVPNVNHARISTRRILITQN